MKTEKKKNNKIYWALKIGGVIISCILPIWAILEKFPMWTNDHGTGKSIGIGAILAIIVILIICRKAVFKFLNDKLKLNHAPPIIVWLVMLVISYILIFISNFLRDLTVVLWMGLIGCALGNVLTYVGENFFAEEDADEDQTKVEVKEE